MLRMTLGSIASVPNRIPSVNPDVAPQIHPEGGNKIKNNRRAHCEKTYVNKILANGRSRNMHLLSDVGTHPKQIVFYKLP